MIKLLEQYWMITFAWAVCTSLGYFIGYAFINWADKHKHRQKWWFKYPMYVYGAFFVLFLDVPFQMLMTGAFLDLPREWLFTGRMQRYKELARLHDDDQNGYEYMLAESEYAELSWLNKIRYNVALAVCKFLNKNGQDKEHC